MKEEDVIKLIDGIPYYRYEYADFLYQQLEEKDKEIERLNNKLSESIKWSECRTKEWLNYKSRNEKAIEYIYEHREEALFEDNNGKLVYALSDNFDEGDLLSILQGEDKNE